MMNELDRAANCFVRAAIALDEKNLTAAMNQISAALKQASADVARLKADTEVEIETAESETKRLQAQSNAFERDIKGFTDQSQGLDISLHAAEADIVSINAQKARAQEELEHVEARLQEMYRKRERAATGAIPFFGGRTYIAGPVQMNPGFALGDMSVNEIEGLKANCRYKINQCEAAVAAKETDRVQKRKEKQRLEIKVRAVQTEIELCRENRKRADQSQVIAAREVNRATIMMTGLSTLGNQFTTLEDEAKRLSIVQGKFALAETKGKSFLGSVAELSKLMEITFSN